VNDAATAAPVGGLRDVEASHRNVVEHLRALIRLPTVNPPGNEILAARYVAEVLTEAGLEPEVLEPFPGRGNVVARLHGDGSAHALLLLAHLDVVPADAERWRHEPFAADVADGYVWGRGALDMKGMLAMELAVVLELAREARDAGLDPARDAIPGLRRDVILAATADEEAGGFQGIGWIVEHRPELLRADAALNEAGGVPLELAGRRFYPVQVAEKGFAPYRIVVRGTAGHGSMPSDENAAVRAARVVERLSGTGPRRVTAVMEAAIRQIAEQLPPDAAAAAGALLADDEAVVDRALDRLCPSRAYRRALRALLRDTASPNIVRTGTKYNVIPGVAEIQVDYRQLPGTSAEAIEEDLRRRIGDDLLPFCTLERIALGDPVEQPREHPLLDLIGEVLLRHDPDAIPLPVMAPFATDAKHTAKLGIPTFGFSPLRLPPSEPFLDLFHGDDERVPLDALRWGLPLLHEVVRRYCG
jgi:acetylornithine deacetylase/succinyl-diaminopimelate desuccinylase-like protein